MKPSLFSQSLFALPLEEAVTTTALVGYPAIELACAPPHLELERARRDAPAVARRIAEAGLEVSALSLFNNFTVAEQLEAQVAAADELIRLAPLFKTSIIKLTPGQPASADATDTHWDCLIQAVERLAPTAREVGVRLAFETHMRQLTDTLAGSLRLLELTPADVVGLTVDFSNLAFAGEHMTAAIDALADRMFHTHLKNGCIDEAGWHFQALDQGLTDYDEVLPQLQRLGYTGYLSIECLGPEPQQHPRETARRDLVLLQQFMERMGA